MKLEDQVCSLELAKKLKELAVKQSSYFYYVPTINNNNIFGILSLESICNIFDNYISAFTVAELGEMLPKELVAEDKSYFFTQCPSRDLKRYIVFYRHTMSFLEDCESDDKKEADARAKMLIHLIENKLIELPE